MNQTEQMRIESPVPLTEAEMKVFKLGWLECLAAQQALAAKPAKLVRLTESEYIPLWFDFGRLRIEESVRRYSERFMDALEAKNGGA